MQMMLYFTLNINTASVFIIRFPFRTSLVKTEFVWFLSVIFRLASYFAQTKQDQGPFLSCCEGCSFFFLVFDLLHFMSFDWIKILHP